MAVQPSNSAMNLSKTIKAIQSHLQKKTRKMGNTNRKSLTKFLCQTLKKNKMVDSEATAATVDEDDEAFFTPKSSPIREEHVFDLGQPSEVGFVTFTCEICQERTPLRDSFDVKGCAHFYCIPCTISYIESKLQQNITSISCPVPNCVGVLDPDYCRAILPVALFDRWGIALCEAVFTGSEKFYCPYNDCSALLYKDGATATRISSCPFCKRKFCVQCKVAWHTEINCATFQQLKRRGGDAMLVDLIERKKWQRCPSCKYFVGRSSGCSSMKCRCGFAFCYTCGKSWNGFHRCTAIEQ